MTTRMRHSLLALFVVLTATGIAACAAGTVDDVPLDRLDPSTISWVAPTLDEQIVAGDPVTLTVSTGNSQAHRIDFAVDGMSVGSCDADDPMEDCLEDNLWSTTTTFTTSGPHTLTASFQATDGHVVSVDRQVTVLDASTPTPTDPGSSGTEPDPMGDMSGSDPGMSGDLYPDIPTDPGSDGSDPGVDDLGSDETGMDPPAEPTDGAIEMPYTRGYLDPSRGFHNVFRGRYWAIRGQRILLRHGRIFGDVEQVASCMARYGDAVQRYADTAYVSRASIVALMIAETGCTDPSPRPGAMRAGPVAVRASVCSALNPTLSHHDCLLRMSLDPSASIDTAVRYLSAPTMRRIHHNDPVKLAAAFHVGALRRTGANPWHLVSPAGYITRFVQAYNAYRSWEALGRPTPGSP